MDKEMCHNDLNELGSQCVSVSAKGTASIKAKNQKLRMLLFIF